MRLGIKFDEDYKIIDNKVVIATVMPRISHQPNYKIDLWTLIKRARRMNNDKLEFIGKAVLKDEDTSDIELAKKIAYDKAVRHFWKLFTNAAVEYRNEFHQKELCLADIALSGFYNETTMENRIAKFNLKEKEVKS